MTSNSSNLIKCSIICFLGFHDSTVSYISSYLLHPHVISILSVDTSSSNEWRLGVSQVLVLGPSPSSLFNFCRWAHLSTLFKLYIYNYIYISQICISFLYLSFDLHTNIKCLLDNFGHPIGTSNLMFYATVLIIYHKYLSLQSPPGFFSFQRVGQVKT